MRNCCTTAADRTIQLQKIRNRERLTKPLEGCIDGGNVLAAEISSRRGV